MASEMAHAQMVTFVPGESGREWGDVCVKHTNWGGGTLRRGSLIRMLSFCTADNRVTSSDNRLVPHKSVRMVVAFGLELVIGWIANSPWSVMGYLTK